MLLIYEILFAVIACISIALYIIKDRMSYWTKRGILHDEPKFFFGNMREVSRSKHMMNVIREVYTKYKGTAPFCGFFFFMRPVIIALSLDFVKMILIKDFNYFVSRSNYYNKRDDPLSANLFALDGSIWRQMRSKLSPTFTSGKMKFMFPTVVEVGQRFAKVFRELVGTGSVVEMKDILARFSTDVIGTCAFGIECNSLNDPNAEFRTYGKKFFTKPRHSLKMICLFRSCPNVARALRCRLTSNDVHDFFMRTVRDTVEYREKNGIVRNDFMNLLIELKNNKCPNKEGDDIMTGLTLEELAAQAFVFFLGGFETSSTTLGFALFELAMNQDIQDKVRREVNAVLENNGGVLSYDCMRQMHFVDQVLHETLRKYTVAFNLNREATSDYVVPETNFKIKKGTMVIIPSYAIHHDPEIYPNPELFDPERFSDGEMKKRDPIAWLGFGDGPRNCIGLRFGKMQFHLGLSLLIKDFRFHISEKMSIPMEFDMNSIVLSSKEGIFLRVEPLK